MRKLLFFCLLLASIAVGETRIQKDSATTNEFAPTIYPQKFFKSPLDIPLTLAGNFGEIRTNHFHSGLDFKTENREGLAVYAPADGYVSRLKVQAAGYGNALYITHPNGYVTVYGHLSAYNPIITSYLRKEQYAKESFEVDIMLAPDAIPVKQSEIVAYTGNSGGSRGPHLHFEIRDEKTEFAINPLLFGFDVKDSVKPVISKVAIYPGNDISYVDYKNEEKLFQVVKNGNELCVAQPLNDTVKVHGFIGFGIDTYDTEDARTNLNGTYSVELKVDDETIYLHKINTFSFDQWRYVNAHIDYPEKKKKGCTLQRCYVLPNNRLPIYEIEKNRGYFIFTDDKSHKINLVAKDFFGNNRSVEFYVKSTSIAPQKIETPLAKNIVQKFNFDKENTYNTNNFLIDMPSDALYNDIDFEYSVSDSLKNSLAPVFHVHKDLEPVQSFYTIGIKPKQLPEKWRNKTLIVSLSGKVRTSQGGEWDNAFGGIKTQTKTFGNFTLAIDTTAPVIVPINKFANKNCKAYKILRFKMYDTLSGIKSFRGTIDGKWVLMQYDAKFNLLYYVFDEKVKSGKHEFKIIVEDKKGNTKTFACNFLR